MENKNYQFAIQGPITVDLIKRAAGEKKTLNPAEIEKIAREKLPYLNTEDLEKAKKTVAGTARSLGVKINESH